MSREEIMKLPAVGANPFREQENAVFLNGTEKVELEPTDYAIKGEENGHVFKMSASNFHKNYTEFVEESHVEIPSDEPKLPPVLDPATVEPEVVAPVEASDEVVSSNTPLDDASSDLVLDTSVDEMHPDLHLGEPLDEPEEKDESDHHQKKKGKHK
jgi:hypothetical protein